MSRVLKLIPLLVLNDAATELTGKKNEQFIKHLLNNRTYICRNVTSSLYPQSVHSTEPCGAHEDNKEKLTV